MTDARKFCTLILTQFCICNYTAYGSISAEYIPVIFDILIHRVQSSDKLFLVFRHESGYYLSAINIHDITQGVYRHNRTAFDIAHTGGINPEPAFHHSLDS